MRKKRKRERTEDVLYLLIDAMTEWKNGVSFYLHIPSFPDTWHLGLASA
jgi:hypothetical protein